MRPRWWFEIAWIVVGMLALVSVTITVIYVADENEAGDAVPPVIKAIPYVVETETLEQPEQLAEESILMIEKSYKEDIVTEMYPAFSYSREWNDEDTYLLAKIAMAEAEGSTIQCKSLIIMAVLNRANSDQFPDFIREVIFQCDERTGVYQFSCIGNGRWDRVEPDQDCYDAVSMVCNSEYDYSGGALYFESCSDEDNWHSQNLDFLYQCDEFKFYR